MLFMSCVCHAFASVHCCPVVTYWERADLFAPVCDVYSDFVTFPLGILGKAWYLIVSIPDICCLSYFVLIFHFKHYHLGIHCLPKYPFRGFLSAI